MIKLLVNNEIITVASVERIGNTSVTYKLKEGEQSITHFYNDGKIAQVMKDEPKTASNLKVGSKVEILTWIDGSNCTKKHWVEHTVIKVNDKNVWFGHKWYVSRNTITNPTNSQYMGIRIKSI